MGREKIKTINNTKLKKYGIVPTRQVGRVFSKLPIQQKRPSKYFVSIGACAQSLRCNVTTIVYYISNGHIPLEACYVWQQNEVSKPRYLIDYRVVHEFWKTKNSSNRSDKHTSTKDIDLTAIENDDTRDCVPEPDLTPVKPRYEMPATGNADDIIAYDLNSAKYKKAMQEIEITALKKKIANNTVLDRKLVQECVLAQAIAVKSLVEQVINQVSPKLVNNNNINDIKFKLRSAFSDLVDNELKDLDVKFMDNFGKTYEKNDT